MRNQAWARIVVCSTALIAPHSGCGGSKVPPSLPVPEEDALEKERQCILQHLPRRAPADSAWIVSGYDLVDSYLLCQKSPARLNPAAFQSLVESFASPVAGDASKVRIKP